MSDLAAIIEEGERQQAAVASSDLFVNRFDEWRAMELFYIKHGPLLLRLAKAGAETEPFLRRVAAGPCWVNRGSMAECKDAFLPKGKRPASEFCLRCHAVDALAALDAAQKGR